MHYIPAKIYPEDLNLAVKKWHIEYRYTNPSTGKKQRFKVYEDINRYEGAEKIKYAEELKKAVNTALDIGYSPFAIEKKEEAAVQEYEQQLAREATGDKSNYTILRALNFFLEQKKVQGVSPATIDAYGSTVRFFKNWLNDNGMLLVLARDITDQNVLTFMAEYAALEFPKSPLYNKGKKKWGNKAYNNHLNYIGVVFNFLAERPHRIIPESPLVKPTPRETFERKHTAYSDSQLTDLLTIVRTDKNTFVEGLILSIYYACIRSKAELREFRAGNVLYDRDLIRLDAEGTKGKRDDYMPLDPILKQHFIDQGYDKLPADWYIFGEKGQPGPRQAAENYYAKKFRPYRDALGWGDEYTLYGFKHTRVVHLAQAKVSPYALIQLTRHKSIEELMNYLRDLGCTMDFETVENSRVI